MTESMKDAPYMHAYLFYSVMMISVLMLILFIALFGFGSVV